MRLLAELGADPLLPNEDGTTPLMVAAGVGTQAPAKIRAPSRRCSKPSRWRSPSATTSTPSTRTARPPCTAPRTSTCRRSCSYLAEKGAQDRGLESPEQKGWTPLKIAEGVQRGMNIVSSPVNGRSDP